MLSDWRPTGLERFCLALAGLPPAPGRNVLWEVTTRWGSHVCSERDWKDWLTVVSCYNYRALLALLALLATTESASWGPPPHMIPLTAITPIQHPGLDQQHTDTILQQLDLNHPGQAPEAGEGVELPLLSIWSYFPSSHQIFRTGRPLLTRPAGVTDNHSSQTQGLQLLLTLLTVLSSQTFQDWEVTFLNRT